MVPPPPRSPKTGLVCCGRLGPVLTTRATLDKHRADVASMFDGVAQRYDVMNSIMTLGAVDRWRDLVVDAVEPAPGQVILDLAAGTGTSSATFAARGAEVYPTDISMGMLQVGHQRQPGLHFVAGDATRLPYADDSFDAVTISYGLRNVENTSAALAEMLRVTRPGGRLVVCEFSTPTWAPFRRVYKDYLLGAIPAMARLASSNRDAYDYLAESILAWPDQQRLADLMSDAGWRAVAWRNISGGVVALHRAWKA
nr:demethylmenaquinone methyltransferase [Acidipropionibacterium virtanenii]